MYFFIPNNYKNPYAESWNLAVQQAFRGNLSLQLAYVANHGVDISGSQNINNPTHFRWRSEFSARVQLRLLPSQCAPHSESATNQYFLGYSSNYQSLQTAAQQTVFQ